MSPEAIEALVGPHLADLSEADQDAARSVMGQLDPQIMLQLIADASEAANLRAAGDEAGCQAILGRYRELVDRFGLGPAFDQLLGEG
jgi:hypothetical protein